MIFLLLLVLIVGGDDTRSRFTLASPATKHDITFVPEPVIENPFLTPKQQAIRLAQIDAHRRNLTASLHRFPIQPILQTDSHQVMCDLLAPGLDRLMKGIDITTLDLFPSDITQPGGYRQSILEFTCTQGKTWRHPAFADRIYSWPDQVQGITSVPAGSLSVSTSFNENMEEVKESMATKVNLEMSLGWFGSFSGSTSYNEAKENMIKSDKSIVETSATVSSIEYDFIEPEALKLSPYFKEFIDSLPENYDQNPQLYDDFVNTFGTHYFDIGKFGGFLYQKTTIDNAYLKETDKKEVQANLKLSFKAFAGIKADVGTSFEQTSKQSKETFSKNTENNFYYYGGVSKFTTGDDENYMAKWWDTVNEDPWLFGGQLRPIEWLVEDENKQKQVEKAISLRLVRSYRNDLISSYKISKLSLNRETNQSLSRIDEYLNSPNGDVDSIKDREKDIKRLFANWEKENKFLARKNTPTRSDIYHILKSFPRPNPSECEEKYVERTAANGTKYMAFDKYSCPYFSYYEENDPAELPGTRSICFHINSEIIPYYIDIEI